MVPGRNFALSLADCCRFCGKHRDAVRALVGTVGRETAICEECIGISWDILAHELGDGVRPPTLAWLPATPPPAAPVDDETRERVNAAADRMREEMLAHARELAARRTEAEVARRRELQQRRLAQVDPRCSFCDAQPQDRRKLISGPRVWVCDTCVGEATVFISDVLRAD